MSTKRNVISDAWHRVERRGESECWPWMGTIDQDGYGRFWLDGRLQAAHRVIFLLANDRDPADLCVCHTCDNRPCVNPAHLFLGTNAENMQDKISKGRQIVGERVPGAKLTETQVIQIRELYDAGWDRRDLAEVYGVTPTNISSIGKRIIWKQVAA